MKKYIKSNELKRLRGSLGWNQARLGEEVGVSLNTVARWERGASPVPKAVARLVRLLAVDATPSAVGNSSLITRDSHHAAILKAFIYFANPSSNYGPRQQNAAQLETRSGVAFRPALYPTELPPLGLMEWTGIEPAASGLLGIPILI